MARCGLYDQFELELVPVLFTKKASVHLNFKLSGISKWKSLKTVPPYRPFGILRSLSFEFYFWVRSVVLPNNLTAQKNSLEPNFDTFSSKFVLFRILIGINKSKQIFVFDKNNFLPPGFRFNSSRDDIILLSSCNQIIAISSLQSVNCNKSIAISSCTISLQLLLLVNASHDHPFWTLQNLMLPYRAPQWPSTLDFNLLFELEVLNRVYFKWFRRKMMFVSMCWFVIT